MTSTYIYSPNPKGQVSSFKTIELGATQSLATNLMNALNIELESIAAAIEEVARSVDSVDNVP